MEVEGRLQAEVSLKSAKLYPSTNAKMACVRLSVRVDPAKAKKAFGEHGALMFPSGGQRSEDGKYHHPYSNPRPEGTLGGHVVKLLEREFKLVPILADVKAVDDQEAVDVEIDLPLDIDKTKSKWFGELLCSVGESVEVEFKPQQLSLPGTKEDGGGLKIVPGPHGSKVAKSVG